MILWTEQFATGIERLDEQHRTWILNINHLEALLTTTNPTRAECEFLIHLVDFLEAYPETHFTLEEQCMESYRCPAQAQNQQAHASYRRIFHNYRLQSAREGFNVELHRKLHASASSWIQDHILNIDTQLRPCVKKSGGVQPGA